MGRGRHGDAANIASKVIRFLSRNATMVDDVLAAIAKLDDIPVSVRADILRRVNISRQIEKDALLRANGDDISDRSLGGQPDRGAWGGGNGPDRPSV